MAILGPKIQMTCGILSVFGGTFTSIVLGESMWFWLGAVTLLVAVLNIEIIKRSKMRKKIKKVTTKKTRKPISKAPVSKAVKPEFPPNTTLHTDKGWVPAKTLGSKKPWWKFW